MSSDSDWLSEGIRELFRKIYIERCAPRWGTLGLKRMLAADTIVSVGRRLHMGWG